MTNDEESIEGLVRGGLIGAALGALISNNKDGAILGALAGAAIAASMKANAEAVKTNLPLIMEKDGNLYEISPDGEERLIRSLHKSTKLPKKNFKLT